MKILKRLVQLIPVLLLGAGLGIDEIALRCTDPEPQCSLGVFFTPLFTSIWTPLYLFSEYAIWGGIILIFVPWRIFKSWLKFGIPWLLFSIFLVAITFESSPSLLGYDELLNKMHLATYTGIIFSVVTIIIVLVQLLKKPKVV